MSGAEFRPLDLAGQRYGRLIALAATDLRLCRSTIWRCACDCGGTALPTACDLKRGHTRSCGCLHIESVREMGKGTKGVAKVHQYRSVISPIGEVFRSVVEAAGSAGMSRYAMMRLLRGQRCGWRYAEGED